VMRVAPQDHQFSRRLQYAGIDIRGLLFIGLAQGTRHQAAQMIHGDALAPIWIKRGMGEPAKNGSRPATQLEIGKLAAVDIFEGHQDRTHFLLGMSLHHTERSLGIQTTAKLPEDGCLDARRFL
jgi:hypothetical protein